MTDCCDEWFEAGWPPHDVQDSPNELLHIVCDGLQAVAVIQHIGHRQIDPAQLADMAGKLDGCQGVPTQL